MTAILTKSTDDDVNHDNKNTQYSRYLYFSNVDNYYYVFAVVNYATDFFKSLLQCVGITSHGWTRLGTAVTSSTNFVAMFLCFYKPTAESSIVT